MAENGEDDPRADVAVFRWLRRPGPDRLALRVAFQGTQVVIDWPVGSDEPLDRLLAYLPTIMTTARKERQVLEFVRDMDSELEQLLGGDE